MIKVVQFKKLKSGKKKYEITFEKNGKKYVRKFGSLGMSDYTIHKDKERRERYISRHKKDLRTKDPMKPGYLSMYILWNKPTIKASLADYKKRLNTFNRTGKFPTQITGSKKLSFGAQAMSKEAPINRKLCRAEQLRLYEKSLPSEVTDVIKKHCYANVIKKNYKSVDQRFKIILLLKKQGKINFQRTNDNVYNTDLVSNYDIITDSGTEISRAMVRLLTKEDFASKADLWHQLVFFGLTQIKDMYDILFENNGNYDTYKDENVIFQQLEQQYGNINDDTDNIFENFNENVDFILDLLERAGQTYFTRVDNEDYSDAGRGVPIDYLIRAWQTLNISGSFGKKGKGINQFGAPRRLPSIPRPKTTRDDFADSLFYKLPDEIYNKISNTWKAPYARERLRSFVSEINPKLRIRRILRGMAEINFEETGDNIFRPRGKARPEVAEQLNMSILRDSGVEILRLANAYLTTADYRNEPYWYRLISLALLQLTLLVNVAPSVAGNGLLLRSLRGDYNRANHDESFRLLLQILPKINPQDDPFDNEFMGVLINGNPSPQRMMAWWRENEAFNVAQFGKKGKTTGSKIPDNVVNKALYSRIKAKIRKDVDKKKRRWGAYDSGRLVREYKSKGGKYRGGKGKGKGKGKTNLGRWYKEKWVDACAWPKRKSCGRKTKEKIAYCRPSKKVDSKTPKLVQDLTKAQIKSRCAKKKRNPMKRVTKFGAHHVVNVEYADWDGTWGNGGIGEKGDFSKHCTFIDGVGPHVTIRYKPAERKGLDISWHYGMLLNKEGALVPGPVFWPGINTPERFRSNPPKALDNELRLKFIECKPTYLKTYSPAQRRLREVAEAEAARMARVRAYAEGAERVQADAVARALAQSKAARGTRATKRSSQRKARSEREKQFKEVQKFPEM